MNKKTMKKLNLRILILGILSSFSCEKSSFEKEVQRNPTDLHISSSQQQIDLVPKTPNSKNFISFGGNGSLEVRSFQIVIGPSQRNVGSLILPSDYVIIGGGASITCPPSPCGGLNLFPSSFLTASRPDFTNNSWVAASKDHLNPESHYLRIYAIGIKICSGNVTPAQLRSYMQVFSSTSNVQAHPSASISVPQDYDMLGGGAQINYGNGAGSLLVSSYPSSSNTWTAQGKDHFISSPASITAYAIGIKKIVDFAYCPVCTPIGLFNVSINSSSSFASSGRSSALVNLPNSNPFPWFAACSGARTTFNGFGRMLQTSIIDDEYIQAIATAKDLNRVDQGWVTSYFIAIQPTACWCC